MVSYCTVQVKYFVLVISTFSSFPESFSESVLQSCYLTDEVGDGIRESLLWTVVRCGLYSKDELVFKGVWHLVTCK